MSGRSYQDRVWAQHESQVKPDFTDTPIPNSKEPITILDSDDEAQMIASSKRPLKRARAGNESASSPTTEGKAMFKGFLEGRKKAEEFSKQRRDAQEKLERDAADANERQAELEKIIKELQEENSRKNAIIMTSPSKAELEDANAEKARLQLELGRTQSALTNAVSEKVESQQKSMTLVKEMGQTRLKISAVRRELEGANEKNAELEEHIAELKEHIAELEEHNSSCIVGQQPPEFFERSREVCQRIMDNYAKLAAARGWETNK
ncbi:hypothetical protein SLS62_008820 [Diatrype stigma]|uniref:Uncharacterized protein n=1 Tax=Diatrype stigma TaxID=117547 RepID=A0AAN9YM66_9PEZI